MKDAAQDEARDVAENVTQDLAEGVLGAAEDGGVKVFIVARAIFKLPAAEPTLNSRMPPPHSALGQARKGHTPLGLGPLDTPPNQRIINHKQRPSTANYAPGPAATTGPRCERPATP